MVNLGNTLFARSLALHEADKERKRQEDIQFAQLAQQGVRDVEEAKENAFQRELKQAELEGKYRQELGMQPAARPDNAAIAQALGLGGLSSAAARGQEARQRGYQTEDRDLGWRRRQDELGTQYERQKERDVAQFGREQRMATTRYGRRQMEQGTGRMHDRAMERLRHGHALERITATGEQNVLAADAARVGKTQAAKADETRKMMKQARGYVTDWMRTSLQGTGATVTNTATGIMISATAAPKSPEAKARLDKAMMVNDMLMGLREPEQVLELASAVSTGLSSDQLAQLHAKWMGAYMPDFGQGAPGTRTAPVDDQPPSTDAKAALIRRMQQNNEAERVRPQSGYGAD